MYGFRGIYDGPDREGPESEYMMKPNSCRDDEKGKTMSRRRCIAYGYQTA